GADDGANAALALDSRHLGNRLSGRHGRHGNRTYPRTPGRQPSGTLLEEMFRRRPTRPLAAPGVEPVSRTFGQDRGKPIDRWYIERFLAARAADVRGRVLEVAEPTYTQWYGRDDVTHSDVLHAAPGNPQATVVGDLTTGEGLREGSYDC